MRLIKRAARRIGPVRRILEERDWLRQRVNVTQHQLARHAGAGERPLYVPVGHFYSPLPDLDEVLRDEARVFADPEVIPGIDLRADEQFALMRSFRKSYDTQPFASELRPGLRYHFDHPSGSYGHSDALCLHAVLRHLKPKRLVEIGSGHSTCVTLDTVDRFLGGATKVTLVEPYPEYLRTLLRPGDLERVELLPERAQDVPPATFADLGAGDVLFIDSTHVGKVGSDVNHELFHILPSLAAGVWIHVHDVLWPFEYPRPWIEENRGWNEAYMLRAFLQYNAAFRIELMNTFLTHRHRDWFVQNMPLCLKNAGGSIWLQKTA